MCVRKVERTDSRGVIQTHAVLSQSSGLVARTRLVALVSRGLGQELLYARTAGVSAWEDSNSDAARDTLPELNTRRGRRWSPMDRVELGAFARDCCHTRQKIGKNFEGGCNGVSSLATCAGSDRAAAVLQASAAALRRDTASRRLFDGGCCPTAAARRRWPPDYRSSTNARTARLGLSSARIPRLPRLVAPPAAVRCARGGAQAETSRPTRAQRRCSHARRPCAEYPTAITRGLATWADVSGTKYWEALRYQRAPELTSGFRMVNMFALILWPSLELRMAQNDDGAQHDGCWNCGFLEHSQQRRRREHG